MISGTWANRKIPGLKGTVSCHAQSAIHRDGSDFSKKTQGLVHSTVLRKSIDILAGQVPLGCADKWQQINQTVVDDIPVETIVDSQYIVALQSPDAWFVSNMVTKLRLNATKEESAVVLDMSTIVTAIREKVQTDLAMEHYHEAYTRYLITPSQISWIHKDGAVLDHEKRVEIALSNLKGKNVLIVMSERMEKSLEMIQYLIDGKKELEVKFQQALELISRSETENSFAPSTDVILAELKKDSDFYENLEEYLKHEQRIYSEAKEMHSSQLKWIQKSRLL
jgi:hypothetical protein